MRKKSNSVLLISALVVAALFIGVGGMTGVFTDPGRLLASPELPKPDKAAPTQGSTDKSKENAAKELQSARKAKASMRPGEEEEQKLVNGVPVEPTVLIQEARIVKPTTNDSNVSAQWYRPESRQNARAEEKEREREATGG